MVRKLVFLLIPLFFIGCVSDPAPVSVEPSVPDVEPVVIQNPSIRIDVSEPDIASITVSYSADYWAFINGVILKNGAGEEKRYTFKNPRRTVRPDASIYEVCIYISQNTDIPPIVHYYADELRAFVAVGDITARPLADNKTFSFMPVDIIY